jgi:lipoprotein signal peptidase
MSAARKAPAVELRPSRWSTAGSAVDFAGVDGGTYHLWAFEVAGSAIFVGVTIVILDRLGAGPHVSKTV